MTKSLPRIALTLGDVAGIGPEVVVRAIAEQRLTEFCRPLVIGHPAVVKRAKQLIGATFDIIEVDSLAEIDWCSPSIPCWNPSIAEAEDVPVGRTDARAAPGSA